MRQYFVYMMTNKNNKVLYTGFTGNLEGRTFLHKESKIEGFTKKYKVSKLVYYEVFENPTEAILREKQIKGLLRSKKNDLVKSTNPDWNDLAAEWKWQISHPERSEGSRFFAALRMTSFKSFHLSTLTLHPLPSS